MVFFLGAVGIHGQDVLLPAALENSLDIIPAALIVERRLADGLADQVCGQVGQLAGNVIKRRPRNRADVLLVGLDTSGNVVFSSSSRRRYIILILFLILLLLLL